MHAVQYRPDIDGAALQGEFAIAAAPGQAAAQAERAGAPVVPAQVFAPQVGFDVRRGARAGQRDRARQRPAGPRCQVGQIQRMEIRVHVQRVADPALGGDPAATQREREIALAVVAVQRERAARVQRSVAQAAGELRHVQRALELAVLTLAPLGGEVAGEAAVPSRGEIAGIETGQRRLHVPVQHRRPADGTGRIQRTGRHGGAQRLQSHALGVAAAVELQQRAVLAARQRGLADGGPGFPLAGQAEVALGADHAVRFRAPAQATGIHREPELGILRHGEIRAPAQRGVAVERTDGQRLHGQDFAVDARMRGLDHHGDIALLHRALQVCRTAGALGHQVKRDRRAVLHHAQQRQVQRFCLGREVPGRLRLAAQRQRRAQRRRCGAGQADVHPCAIATGHQAQAGRGAAHRGREHAGRRQVRVVVVARRVIALHAERTAVAGDGQLLRVHVPIADVDGAGRARNVDDRLAVLAHQEAVDLQPVGLDRQRHFDLRQQVGPVRQLERLIALWHVEHRAAQLQHVQAQALAQQRPQVRFQVDLVGGEADRVPAEIHATQGQRTGDGALDRPVRQRGIRGQSRLDLRQQHVAAGDGLQQPVQADAQQHHQHAGADRAADRQRAHARTAARAQLGDARFALLGRQVVGHASLHRSVPMLR